MKDAAAACAAALKAMHKIGVKHKDVVELARDLAGTIIDSVVNEDDSLHGCPYCQS